MPAIPPDALSSVVYIYPSADAARADEHLGGTGFVMGISNRGPRSGWAGSAAGFEWRPSMWEPFKPDGLFYWLYIVTVAHNVVNKPEVAVRLAGRDSQTDRIMELPRDAWIRHPDGDDVAAALIGPAADYPHLRAVVEDYLLMGSRMMFRGKRPMSRGLPSPGEETFFVGRFIGHEGRGQNAPTARFGNIAMQPTPIYHELFQLDQESWLVEMRSLPGYSGSPVFVYSGEVEVTNNYLFNREDDIEYRPLARLWLLGVDWCHLYDDRPVLNECGEPVDEGWFVKQNSGMMGVVPASKIADILYDEEMVALRDEAEKRWKEHKQRGSSAEPDSAPGDEARTREDFLADLRRAARRRAEEPPSRSGKGKR